MGCQSPASGAVVAPELEHAAISIASANDEADSLNTRVRIPGDSLQMRYDASAARATLRGELRSIANQRHSLDCAAMIRTMMVTLK